MASFTSNKRIEKIAAFAQNRLRTVAAEHGEETHKVDYRWGHLLRMCNYGKLLAEAEGASVELSVAACLLHDVAWFDPGKPEDHGRLGAEVSRPFLETLGYTAEEVDNICYSVASHIDVSDLATLEAKIVTDADNIDRFGPYRALRWCHRKEENYSDLIVRVTDRLGVLKRLKNKRRMETDTGHSLFIEQLDFQIRLLEDLLKENDWTLVPKL